MTADSLAGTGQALFSFVRHWSRRWNLSTDNSNARNARYVLAIETAHALANRDAEVTVNAVAGELGLDQSNASRLIAAAVDAGYLVSARSSVDSRRRVVAVTVDGERLLDAAHLWQDETFARLTRDWSDAERLEFGRGMRRLLARSHALDPREVEKP